MEPIDATPVYPATQSQYDLSLPIKKIPQNIVETCPLILVMILPAEMGELSYLPLFLAFHNSQQTD